MYKFKECLVVLFLACACSAQLNFPAVRESYKDTTRNMYQQKFNPFNQQQYAGRHLTKRVADPSGLQQGTMDSYIKAYKDQHDHFQYQQEAKLFNTNTKRAIKEQDWKPITKLEPIESQLQFDQNSRYGRSFQPEHQTAGLGAYKSVLANSVAPAINKYLGQDYNKHEQAAVTHLNVPLNVQHLNVQLPPELKLYFQKHGMDLANYQAFAMLDSKPLYRLHHPVPPQVHHQVNPQVHHQVVPQVHHQVIPQVHHQVVPQIHHQVVPHVHHQVVPQVHHQVVPQVHHQVVPQMHSKFVPQVHHEVVPAVHEALPQAGHHHVAHQHLADEESAQQLYDFEALLTKPLENDHHVSGLSVNVKDSVLEIPDLQQHHGYDITGKEIAAAHEHKVVEQENHEEVYQHADPAEAYGSAGHHSHAVHHATVESEPHTAHESASYLQPGHHEDHSHAEVHHELPQSAGVHEVLSGHALDHQQDAHHYAHDYAFGYRVLDHKHGNDFGHKQEKKGDVTKGHYHALLPDGRVQNVKYYADKTGYHASLSYEQHHDHAHSAYGLPHH